MRHAQFAKRYLSRVLLTAVMAGMLAAGVLAWETRSRVGISVEHR